MNEDRVDVICGLTLYQCSRCSLFSKIEDIKYLNHEKCILICETCMKEICDMIAGSEINGH